MKLNLQNLDEIKKVVDNSPSFDIEQLAQKTKEDPKWVAFGTGNIFRAYIARVCQELVDKGEFDRGINAIETRDKETVDVVYRPNDNLFLSVELQKSGNMETTLIGSIGEAVVMYDEHERMLEIFRNENLQFASFTITEKGYDIYDNEGNVSKKILEDIKNDPKESFHLMVNMIGFLYERYKHNKAPITLLSIDNLSKNGDVLKDAILTVAKLYVEEGRYEEEFLDYLNDETKVSYPWTMIDKITPASDDNVKDHLEELGFEDIGPFERDNKAPLYMYVNSEEAEYLAIEDNFTNGRPDFSKVGCYLVDRETVDKIETMKVTACLNPLHTSLAVFGCLLGYDRIHEEMKDEELVKLIKGLAYDEALPAVEDPKVIDPNEFVDEVINVRFPNPFMPDSPQRIATDTSVKVPVRYGKTLSTYVKENKNLDDLKYIPLSIAGWLRYLLGVDDKGKEFDLSPDPNLDDLRDKLKGIELGKFNVTDELKSLLKNEKIFGVNLEEVGLSDKVIGYLEEFTEGVDAVRNTLIKYTK